MWICCYVSRKYWCKYRGSSWDWTTWKFFMWPMRLWNNFPGQPTSAWMWNIPTQYSTFQHSTLVTNATTSYFLNNLIRVGYKLYLTTNIFLMIWFVLFDYKFCLGWFDLTWFDKKISLINLIWFDLTANYILYYLIWFD